MSEIMKELVHLQGTSGQLDKCEEKKAKMMQQIEHQTGESEEVKRLQLYEGTQWHFYTKKYMATACDFAVPMEKCDTLTAQTYFSREDYAPAQCCAIRIGWLA